MFTVLSNAGYFFGLLILGAYAMKFALKKGVSGGTIVKWCVVSFAVLCVYSAVSTMYKGITREIREHQESNRATPKSMYTPQGPPDWHHKPFVLEPGESTEMLQLPRTDKMLFSPYVVGGTVQLTVVTDIDTFTFVLSANGKMSDNCMRHKSVFIYVDQNNVWHKMERVRSAQFKNTLSHPVTIVQVSEMVK